MGDLTLTGLDDVRWLGLLEANSHDLFSSLRWCRCIADYYGFDAGVALNQTGGGLPYAVVDDYRGARSVVYPFTDTCAPVGPFDMASLQDDGERSGRRWVMRGPLRSSVSERIGVHQRIDLRAERGALAERSAEHRKHLWHVRRAAKAGVTIGVLDDPDLAVAVFYPLYSAFRKRRLKLLPQARAFFDHLAHRYLPRDGFVVVARLDDVIAGVAFVLAHGTTLYYKYSAIDYDRPSVGINNALIQATVELAMARKCSFLDMGISTTGGLERFKESLGCDAVPTYASSFGPAVARPGAGAIGATLTRITELCVDDRMPLSIAQDAGTALYALFA